MLYIKCLQDDFLNFLRADVLSIYTHVPGLTGVMDNYYGFQFIHDFPTMNISSLHMSELEDNSPFMGLITQNFFILFEIIQAKYARRIKRFRDALSGTNEVIFIRTIITKEQQSYCINLSAIIILILISYW